MKYANRKVRRKMLDSVVFSLGSRLISDPATDTREVGFGDGVVVKKMEKFSTGS